MPEQRKVHTVFQWLPCGDDACFSVRYFSSETSAQKSLAEKSSVPRGVIVLPALGHEYNHAHRATHFLCEQLSLSNDTVCVRLDLPGTGDASGDVITRATIERWPLAIESAVELLRREHGVSEFDIVGYRMGGLLASYCVSQLSSLVGECEQLVLWNPYTKGAAFIRDMELLGRAQPGWVASDTDPFDAGGAVLSPDAKALISDLDLGALLSADSAKKITLMQPEELRPVSRMMNSLLAKNIAIGAQTYTGNPQFQKPALLNLAPLDAVSKIVATVAHPVDTPKEEPKNELHEKTKAAILPRLLSTPQSSSSTSVAKGIQEHIIIEPVRGLVGVLCQPRAETKKLIVLLNGGAAHHVGPGRLYVNMSRNLAVAGCNVLRVDLSRLGDGQYSTESITETLHPFPNEYQQDIHHLLAFLEAEFGFEQFSLGGLCSAGHNAFQYQLAEKDTRIKEILLINPMHLYWQQGQSYLPYDPSEEGLGAKIKRAVNLLKGWRSFDNKISWAQQFVIGLFSIAIALFKRISDACSLVKEPGSTFKQDVAKLSACGTRMHFLISKNETGIKRVKSLFGLGYWVALLRGRINVDGLPDTDHAFVIRAQQKSLFEALVKKYQ